LLQQSKTKKTGIKYASIDLNRQFEEINPRSMNSTIHIVLNTQKPIIVTRNASLLSVLLNILKFSWCEYNLKIYESYYQYYHFYDLTRITRKFILEICKHPQKKLTIKKSPHS